MKKLLTLIILISAKSFAQQSETLVQDTLFLNKNFEITTKEKADVIRIILDVDPGSNGFIFKDFNAKGKLEKSGIITKKVGKPNGLISEHYETGTIKNEGVMDITRKGNWKEWYQNETLKSEIEYVSDDQGKMIQKMINFYDST